MPETVYAGHVHDRVRRLLVLVPVQSPLRQSPAAPCARVLVVAAAVHGDDETPVDYVCELGKKRAAQFAAVLESRGEEKRT